MPRSRPERGARSAGRRSIEAPAIEAIRAAAERIRGTAIRTPLLRLWVDSPAEIYLKPENLQPIGSFKIRGAANAVAMLSKEQLQEGVYTASAGNMAQGLAWAARAAGVSCSVVVPDSAPRAKLDAMARLGARAIPVPYDDWWRTLAEHGDPTMRETFVHPVADTNVIAGNGTTGLEIVEDLPDVDTILVPFGGGGLSTGIAAAVRAISSKVRVFGCEVETATPLASALKAGGPVQVERTPSFVDGIGGKGVLPEMWALVSALLAGSRLVSLAEVESAIRTLSARAHVIAEGAGGASLAAALKFAEPGEKVVCVVSGGNIDPGVLARILTTGV